MGDVLMTIPVIDSFARQYPNVRLTVVSRPWAKPIFDLLPSNVSFLGVDFRGAHSGYHGLNLLGRRLLGLQPTHIADLHDVLRTKWLRLRFNMAGLKVSHIKKGRCARKAFINAEKKRQQKTAFEKYADVFRRLGFRDFQIEFHSLYPKGGANLAQFLPSFNIDTCPEPYWIGIAPFAAHEGKVYWQCHIPECRCPPSFPTKACMCCHLSSHRYLQRLYSRHMLCQYQRFLHRSVLRSACE